MALAQEVKKGFWERAGRAYRKTATIGSMTLLGLGLYTHKAQAQDLIEWLPMNVTQHVSDSASDAPIAGANIHYEALDQEAPAQANYDFQTDEQGETTQSVLAKHKKPDAVNNTPTMRAHGMGINNENNKIAVSMKGNIKNVTIINITGQYVKAYTVEDRDGEERINTDLEGLAPGNYIAIAQNDRGEREVLKFTHQRGLPQGWQVNNKDYNPTTEQRTAQQNTPRLKSTTIDEITTAYLRTINAQGYKTLQDTILLRYNEGADTTINTELAKEEQPPTEYERRVIIQLNPTKGKKLPDGTKVTLDDLATTTKGDSAVFTYKTTKATEQKNLAVQGAQDYEDLQASITVDEENEHATQEIRAKDYQAPISVHAQDEDQGDATGASIEVAGQQAYADELGKATFRIALETDQYNRFTPYTAKVQTSKGNSSHDFETKEQTITLDTTKQDIEQTVAFINEFFYESNNSTTIMNIKIYKDGEIKSQTTSDEQGHYKTNPIKNTQLTFKPDSTTYTKQGMIPQTTTTTMHDGGDTQDITLQEQTNQYWLHDDQSTPEGASIKGWKDGTLLLYATINNNAYETNHIQSKQESMTLDSLITTMTGYDKDTKINYTITPGGQRQRINLQATQTQNTYIVQIETLGPILATPVTEGIINIITQSDGKSHNATIDSDGITNFTITGPYEPNEQVKIEIGNNTYYTNGTFALLHNNKTAIAGKIGSRMNIEGYIKHDLQTTLDEIDNPEGNYATMFPDSTTTNNNVMESLSHYPSYTGLQVWAPRDDNGNLMETIKFYNRLDDQVTGEIVSQERADRQKAALQFFQDKGNTTSGKKLYYAGTITQGIGLPSDGRTYVVMCRNNTNNAGSNRSFIENGSPYFRSVIAHTKDSDNPNKDITELDEGLGINDDSSGQGIFSITYDNEGKINGFSTSGKIVWTSTWTYQAEDFKK